MTLAFGFATPWLLLGLLAAAIPFVLHLLSSVRAQDMYFPTLRFLRLSMEKTARRRRIQHWLLLILRAALLAVLALAVAEPISRAMGGWLGRKNYAAVIVLDNSFSMGASADTGTRFARAKAQASALLGGDSPPHLAGVITTNGGFVSSEVTADTDDLGEAVDRATLSAGRAPLAESVARAARMLSDEPSTPQKSVYVFSDLQRASFEDLVRAEHLARDGEIHLMIVNTARRARDNVGISDVQVGGRRFVNSVLEVTATLVGSSRAPRRVRVGLRINGREAAAPREVMLPGKTAAAAEGEDSAAAGSAHPAGAPPRPNIATVRFRTRVGPEPGTLAGEVYLTDPDGLAIDNVRRFSVTIGGKVKALLVRGPAPRGASAAMDPSALLEIALDPWAGDKSVPWSIQPRLLAAGAFTPADLAGADAVFFSNVPAFTPAQGLAIGQYVSRGGTVMIFLGPDVQADAYNKAFARNLLPGKLLEAVGQIGPDADAAAVDDVDMADPYLMGLFKDRADYLTPMVQRYFRLDRGGRGSTVLMRLAGGDPLILVKDVGKGRIALCATTASGSWSNFLGSGANVIVSMVIRACLLAPQSAGPADSFPAGAQVAIRPAALKGKQGKIEVTPPAGANGESRPVLIDTNPDGLASFRDTWRVGMYGWRVEGRRGSDRGGHGLFAVNPHGTECDLRGYRQDELARALRRRGLKRVYIGPSLAEVHAAAEAEAEPKNWWDVVIIVVILLLIVEAVVANRRRGRTEIPAHLNPRLAG